MKQVEYAFSGSKVNCYFDAELSFLDTLFKKEKIIIITDENVNAGHAEKFDGYKKILISPGEIYKTQQTVSDIIDHLLQMEADKTNCIVGVGGGVVTDIAGYAASIYKRGIRLALVPTSILSMADAAIGGKNGVDVGVFKNMIGTTYQPECILYAYDFLETLPVKEWINGFAEIIKHACIKDKMLFQVLEKYDLHQLQADKTLMATLIEQNVAIKMEVVTSDELEKGERRLLNFGHTIGHAIENLHQLPHGHAVSIGMVAACNLSEKINGLHFTDAARVVKLLSQYHLPVDVETDHAKVFDILKLDKKREDGDIHFILLSNIGKAVVKKIPIAFLEQNLKTIL